MASPGGVVKCLLGCALVVLATNLLGCGKKEENNSPAELVSQSVTGDFAVSARMEGKTGKNNAQFAVSFDVETFRLRSEISGMDFQGARVPDATALLDIPKKRFTIHTDVPLPGLNASCFYVDMGPQVPPPEILKSLIEGQIQGRKPTGHDGDYRQWKFGARVSDGPVMLTLNASVALDDQNGLRKSSAVMDGSTENHTFHEEVTFVARKVEVGRPEASLFEVPAAWGTCVPGPDSPNEPALTSLPAVRMLLERLLPALASGAQASEAQNLLV